jgi:8-oxo-dGTP pyrophosphatase MutT (NUDIX family)
MIFRNGKWDLPKGKLEVGESIDVCAKREVQEECGLNDLEIVDKLMNTYHTYEHKGQSILKETHWYLMTSSQNEDISPQIEEGIEKVIWVSREEASDLLENTYENIKRVFEKYYSLK